MSSYLTPIAILLFVIAPVLIPAVISGVRGIAGKRQLVTGNRRPAVNAA